eukprot:Nk52_evm35s236 gene=Nk52_evmTU35s236
MDQSKGEIVGESPVTGTMSGGKTLFVRNLPFAFTNQSLEDTFGVFGPMKKCFVVADPKNPTVNRGFGYVTFSLKEDADSAVAKMHGEKMEGRKLKVVLADKKPTLTREQLEEKAVASAAGEKGNKTKKENGEEDMDYETLTAVKAETPSSSASTEEGGKSDNGKKNTKKKSKAERAKPDNNAGRTTLVMPVEGFTKESLLKECKALGEVESVEVPASVNGASCAAIVFKTHKQCRRAVKHFSDKKNVQSFVKTAFMRNSAMTTTEKKQKNKKHRLIIRNVSWKCSADDMKKLLQTFGEVVDFNMPLGPKGKCKGFAFVEYDDFEGALKAVEEVNGKDIKGRPVAVDWAVSKNVYEKATEASERTEDAIKEEESEDADVSGSDEEDDDDEGDELEEVEESEIDEEKESVEPEEDVQEGKTLFVTNLCFETREKDLFEKFRHYGRIYYVKLVRNPETGLPKGTGFIKFVDKESADKCMAETGPDAIAEGRGCILDGRIVNVMVAVERKEANERKEEKSKKKKAKEVQRNLFLAKEGIITPDSEAAKHMTKEDLERRIAAWKEKKIKLANPNYFVSDVRLAVRNLPKTCLDADLRKLFEKVKGKKLNLLKAKVILSKDEKKGGKLVPTGFAFVEYRNHEDALTALRAYNNNPDCFESKRRPIVEFSVENRVKLRQHELNLKRRKENSKKNTKEEQAKINDEAEKRELKKKDMDAYVKERGTKRSSSEDDSISSEKPEAKKSKMEEKNSSENDARVGGNTEAKQSKKANKKKNNKKSKKKNRDVVKEEKMEGVALEEAKALPSKTKGKRQKQKKKQQETKDSFDDLLSKYRSKVIPEKTSRWFGE